MQKTIIVVLYLSHFIFPKYIVFCKHGGNDSAYNIFRCKHDLQNGDGIIRCNMMFLQYKISIDVNLKGKGKLAYLSTCINVYSTIACADIDIRKNFFNEKKTVRHIIVNKKNKISLLSKKTRFFGNVITYLPFLFDPMYRFYSKHFQKKLYE